MAPAMHALPGLMQHHHGVMHNRFTDSHRLNVHHSNHHIHHHQAQAAAVHAAPAAAVAAVAADHQDHKPKSYILFT